MRGIAERERRKVEMIVVQAWWNGNLGDLGGKLKPLDHYLRMLKPRAPQTPDQVLAVFREYEARGVEMRVRHFGPDGKELN